jgi:hypothetical protein
VLGGAVWSCGNAGGEDILTSCPSAPLRLQTSGISCNFDANCTYQAPHAVDGFEDGCNDSSCRCTEGKLHCQSFLVWCGDKRKSCPLGIAEGDACTPEETPGGQPSNHECLFGSDASGNRASHACACDLPGPIWRCVPL